MKKQLFNLVLAFFILIHSSCSINGSFQGLYGYQDKVENMNPDLIQRPNSSICNLVNPNSPTIYKINGLELKQCIESIDRSLIYIWRPNCSSSICVPPETIENLCNNRNVELFIVAEYYDLKKMEIKYSIERPIFGIDCKYYNSNLTKTYLTEFLKDVIGNPGLKVNKQYYLFENGELLIMGNDIEQIK